MRRILSKTRHRSPPNPPGNSQQLKLQADLAKARADGELVQKRIEIDRARVEMESITTGVALEAARLQSVMQKEIAKLRADRDRAELEAELAQAEFTRRNNQYKTQEVSWNTRIAELRAKLTEREKELELADIVEERPVYLKEPMQANGDLVISDRRIPLNGLITMETAEFVCSRIDFYNNKNKEFPIFIVIDDSPGGSVMAGYKIVKSMQSSVAPVYVVVKSFAASMAAAICALAPRSYRLSQCDHPPSSNLQRRPGQPDFATRAREDSRAMVAAAGRADRRKNGRHDRRVRARKCTRTTAPAIGRSSPITPRS